MHRFARQTSTGKAVCISQTNKLEGPFECLSPACKQELIAKKGEKNAHHFAHKVGGCGMAYGVSDSKYCGEGGRGGGGESNEHAFCKFWVAENHHSLVLQKHCSNCSAPVSHHTRRYYKETYSAVVEYPLLGGKYVADVALVDKKSKEVKAVIEVFHTHALTSEKYQALLSAGLAVHEVRTEVVIQAFEAPALVYSLKESIPISSTECSQCKGKNAPLIKHSESAAAEAQAPIASTKAHKLMCVDCKQLNDSTNCVNINRSWHCPACISACLVCKTKILKRFRICLSCQNVKLPLYFKAVKNALEGDKPNVIEQLLSNPITEFALSYKTALQEKLASLKKTSLPALFQKH